MTVRAASVRERETRESAWLCLLGCSWSQTVRAPPPVKVEDSRPLSHLLPGATPASAPFPSVCARTHAAHFFEQTSALSQRVRASTSVIRGRTLCGGFVWYTSGIHLFRRKLHPTRLAGIKKPPGWLSVRLAHIQVRAEGNGRVAAHF